MPKVQNLYIKKKSSKIPSIYHTVPKVSGGLATVEEIWLTEVEEAVEGLVGAGGVGIDDVDNQRLFLKIKID